MLFLRWLRCQWEGPLRCSSAIGPRYAKSLHCAKDPESTVRDVHPQGCSRVITTDYFNKAYLTGGWGMLRPRDAVFLILCMIYIYRHRGSDSAVGPMDSIKDLLWVGEGTFTSSLHSLSLNHFSVQDQKISPAPHRPGLEWPDFKTAFEIGHCGRMQKLQTHLSKSSSFATW